MRTPLNKNETILRTSGACHHFALSLVPGNLILTNRRLIFESSLGSHVELIDFSQFRGVRPCWTSFFLIPLFPASISVELKGRGTQRFWVLKRTAWIAAIREATGQRTNLAPRLRTYRFSKFPELAV